MKHIKTFRKIADYTVYKSDTEHFIIPNISYVEETDGVFYKTIQSISNATITCDSATYDGQSHIATNIVVTLYGETLTNGVDYTISGNNGGTNAGNYTFTINGIGSYIDSKQGTFTINKLTPTVTAPTAKVLTFNGTAQELVNAGSTNYGILKYSLDNSTWSTSIPTATNYGSYTVYYFVKGDSNVNSTDVVTVACSINEKQVTAIIELSEDTYTYDGTAKEPTVTVKDGSTVIDPSEYSVAYSNNINAGTATVTISDNVGGNYEVIGSATFTINKANPTYTAPTSKSGLMYNGIAQDLLNAGSTNDGTIQYSSDNSNWSTSISQGTNGGTYSSYWRLVGDNNHNDISSTEIITVITKLPELLDILYSDASGNLSYTSEVLPASEGKTPIGLCIAGTGFFGTNEKARWMSLKYMNYTTPETGSLTAQNICWGNYNTDISTIDNIKITHNGGSNWGYLTADWITGTNNKIPSLYDTNGNWNTSILGTVNTYGVTDIDGKNKTNKMLDTATAQSTWRTDTSIVNINNQSDDTNYAPAACCCWRYHTVGTHAGDWYLGAAGEMSIILTKKTNINTKLAAINAVYSNDCVSSLADGGYFTSTEYSDWYAYYLNANDGYIYFYTKNYGRYVVGMLQY